MNLLQSRSARDIYDFAWALALATGLAHCGGGEGAETPTQPGDSTPGTGGAGPSGTTSEVVPVCGDDRVQGDEACDDGNTQDGDYCSAACDAVTGSCGDGELQSNEVCEGNQDICRSCQRVPTGFTCTTEAPFECSGDGGVPRDLRLADLTEAQAVGLCNWSVDVGHDAIGDGIMCGQTLSLTSRGVDCVNDYAAQLAGRNSLVGCFSTVADFEACVAAAWFSPCQAYRGQLEECDLCQMSNTGDPCTVDTDCTSNQCCVDATSTEPTCHDSCVLGETGDPCLVDDACVGHCDQGTCLTEPLPGGASCMNDGWCQSGNCSLAGYCVVYGVGQLCQQDRDCTTNLCCPTRAQESRCSDGDACLKLVGDACTSPDQCASGDCQVGRGYCTDDCTGGDCGFNSDGIPNYCVGTNPPFCARSCADQSCGALPGTSCQLWTEELVCN